MKRKILSLMVVLAMLPACVPIIANAQTSGTCGENLTWKLDDEGTLTISGKGAMEDWWAGIDGTYAPWYDSCLSITNVVIEEGVTKIGRCAFLSCKNMTSVHIPASVTRIVFNSFGGCDSLSGVYISDLGAWCQIDFDYDKSLAENLYINGERAENIIIPDGVEKISKYVFRDCPSITSVTIPESVKEIGERAFDGCTNLKSLNISDGVEKIDEYAFDECRSLTSVSIPSSVKEIGECAFADCDLSAVEVDANNRNYMSEDGVLYNKDKTEIILYPNEKNAASYAIPYGVTSIAVAAFEDCESLERVDIPESVNEIGACAFTKCINLTSLIIPEGVTELNGYMVVDCEKLASINIPESVTNISWGVFDGTAYYNDESNWTDDVLYIDNCLIEALDTLSGDYQIKDGTRVIAEAAMYYDDGVTSVSIPESVIGIGWGAFEGTEFYKDDANWDNDVLYIDNCLIDAKSSLKGYYRVKDSTRLIAGDAFGGCNYITDIAVPPSVKYINDEAFNGYTYPTVNYVFEAPIAPTLGKNVFPYNKWVPDKEYKITIHEGYEGYTEENGYPADKIIVEPHDYADGICSVCGARETVPPIERIDELGDTKYVFKVNLGQECGNCSVYAAVYDKNGALLAVNRVPLETADSTSILADKSENDALVKVFVWTDELQPILETAEEFPLI